MSDFYKLVDCYFYSKIMIVLLKITSCDTLYCTETRKCRYLLIFMECVFNKSNMPSNSEGHTEETKMMSRSLP